MRCSSQRNVSNYNDIEKKKLIVALGVIALTTIALVDPIPKIAVGNPVTAMLHIDTSLLVRAQELTIGTEIV